MNQTEGRCLMIMTLIASWLFNLILCDYVLMRPGQMILLHMAWFYDM